MIQNFLFCNVRENILDFCIQYLLIFRYKYLLISYSSKFEKLLKTHEKFIQNDLSEMKPKQQFRKKYLIKCLSHYSDLPS